VTGWCSISCRRGDRRGVCGEVGAGAGAPLALGDVTIDEAAARVVRMPVVAGKGFLVKIGDRSVTVEVTSVVRSSDSSFGLRWRERVYENGSLARTDRYSGVLTVVIQRPRDVETLRKNPLGIYVHGINWSRDLATGGDQ